MDKKQKKFNNLYIFCDSKENIFSKYLTLLFSTGFCQPAAFLCPPFVFNFKFFIFLSILSQSLFISNPKYENSLSLAKINKIYKFFWYRFVQHRIDCFKFNIFIVFLQKKLWHTFNVFILNKIQSFDYWVKISFSYFIFDWVQTEPIIKLKLQGAYIPHLSTMLLVKKS